MAAKSFKFSFILFLLYLLVGFIPDINVLDTVIIHWLYISIINSLCLAYFIYKRKEFSFIISSKLSKLFFLLYFLFFIVSLFSITVAINASESIISLTRMSIAFIACTNIYFLLKQDPKKGFEWFVKAIVIILIIESYQTVLYFYENRNFSRSGKLLEGINHNYGNRNVLAATLVIKLPFVLFYYFNFNKIWKWLSLIVIILASSAIILIGARTAVYSMGILLLILIIYYVFFDKNKKQHFLSYLFLLISIGAAYLFSTNINRYDRNSSNTLSQLLFNKTINKKGETKNSNISTNISSNSSNKKGSKSGRVLIWENALEDFYTNPILGSGIGNWKFTPKEKLLKNHKSDNYYIPLSIHNDYLKALSETGIFGFLFYIGMTLLLIYIILKLFFVEKERAKKILYLCLGLSLLVFIFDSFFNFPIKRIPVYLFFIITAVFILLFNENNSKTETNLITKQKLSTTLLFLLLITSFAGNYINYNHFKSSQLERILYTEFNKAKTLPEISFSSSYNDIVPTMNNYITDIDAKGRSKEHLLALFAYSEKKYDKAIEHLDNSIKHTPNSFDSKRLKGIIYYYHIKNKDSAFKYSKEVFKNCPNIKTNYLLLRNLYKEKKDTLNLLKTIDNYLRLKTNAIPTWKSKAYFTLKYYKDLDRALKVIDSGLNFKHRGNQELIKYKETLRKIHKNN